MAEPLGAWAAELAARKADPDGAEARRDAIAEDVRDRFEALHFSKRRGESTDELKLRASAQYLVQLSWREDGVGFGTTLGPWDQFTEARDEAIKRVRWAVRDRCGDVLAVVLEQGVERNSKGEKAPVGRREVILSADADGMWYNIGGARKQPLPMTAASSHG